MVFLSSGVMFFALGRGKATFNKRVPKNREFLFV